MLVSLQGFTNQDVREEVEVVRRELEGKRAG